MSHSTLNQDRRSPDRSRVSGDAGSGRGQSRCSGSASQNGKAAQDASDSQAGKKKRKRRFGWIPILLACLVILCLALGAWVWYQIFHIL
jgi:Flp pilus assembly protein TadB